MDDVAPLVVFLIPDEASYVTGAEIPADGGYTAHRGASTGLQGRPLPTSRGHP
ncbi:SDR family oxidoreductase [Nonomuraea bangladeshensis]